MHSLCAETEGAKLLFLMQPSPCDWQKTAFWWLLETYCIIWKRNKGAQKEEKSFHWNRCKWKTEVEWTPGQCYAIWLLMGMRSRANSCNNTANKDRHFRTLYMTKFVILNHAFGMRISAFLIAAVWVKLYVLFLFTFLYTSLQYIHFKAEILRQMRYPLLLYHSERPQNKVQIPMTH